MADTIIYAMYDDDDKLMDGAKKVVAEGIESQTILNSLKHMACDFAQGFHIARPMPINDLIVWQRNLKNDDFLSDLKSS